MVTLEQAVTLALEKNYDVLLVKNSASSALLDDRYGNAMYLPQLNGVASKTWVSNDQRQELADGSERKGNDIRSNTLSASAQLSWLLFDGTRMFATRERIAEIAAQGEIRAKEQMVLTIATIINNYTNIVRQKQQLNAVQEQMSVSEERVKLAERKLQVGTGGKPELLQARVDLNAQRTQVLQQETFIAQLKDQLNGLVGMQLPAAFDVADTIIINLDIEIGDIENNLEQSNYSLQASRMDLAIANLTLRERRGDYFPTINFNANYNFTRTENAVALNTFSLLMNQNNGYAYGFTMNIPILQGFNRRRLVQQAKLSIHRQEYVYDQLKANTIVGVRNAYVNYDNAKKVLLIEEENILLAKENVFIALEGFKRGVTTFIELRTAQQSLADAYSRLINARYLAKVAETELLRLNGQLLR